MTRSPALLLAGLLAGTLLLTACPGDKPSPGPEYGECTSPPTVLAHFCQGLDAPSFQLPADVQTNPADLSPAERQAMFDCLSWRTFVALNWPVEEGCRGVPNTDAPFGTDGTRVWETYKEVYEVFQSQNASWDPSDQAWNDRQPPAACSDMAGGKKVLRMDTKARVAEDLPDDANEFEQAFAGGFGTLTDQTPALVRYEVRFNRDEFEYIIDNGFATTANYSYSGPLHPPEDGVRFPNNKEGFLNHGAIEVKAAWKELTSEDDASRFYHREVVIFDPQNETQCRPATMGLVGFHIAHKTFWAPQWVWSTFEQVDNVPPAGGAPEPGRSYNFFNPGCTPPPEGCDTLVMPVNSDAQRCCANYQLNPAVFPFPKTPNQVTRLDPIGPTGLNAQFQDLLQGTPFEHYVLINTQWPDGGRDPQNETKIRTRPCNPEGTFPIQPVQEDCYTLTPVHLRNTSMETYMANYGTGHEQFSSDSCMNCHGAGGADSSYVWLDAQLQPLPIADGG